MKLRLEVKQWIARENKIPTLFDAEVLRETDKAYLCSGTGAVDAYATHINCIHCGRELTHPVSRYVGIGPICCENLGVPWDIPESASPEEIEALKRLVRVVTRFNEKWIPKSQVKSKVVLDDTPLATLASEPKPAKEYELTGFVNDTTVRGTLEPVAIIAGSQAVPLPPIKQVDYWNQAFRIVSPYDPDLVARIKALDKRVRIWDFNSKTWILYREAASLIVELVEKDGFTITQDAREALRSELERQKQEIEAEETELLQSTRELERVEAELLERGIELLPFQRRDVMYILDRKRAACGDEMGLGKTPVGLVTVEVAQAYPCLVVCPKNVVLKWEDEREKFLPHRTSQVLTMFTDIKKADMYFINYDILHHYEPLFKAMPLKALILDESHRIKNKNARRSKVCMRLSFNPTLEYRVPLSGTLLRNRPVELVNQLLFMDRLKDFGGFKEFVWRYCAPKHNGWGWDFNGASNLGDLNLRLRKICMTQHSKADVLPDLPPVRYAVIPTELSDREHYNKAEQDIILWLRENVSRAKADAAARAEQLVKINTLRHLVAEQKVEAAIEWIQDFLEGNEGKLLVFGWHKAVLQQLASEFNAPIITGDTSAEDRKQIQDRFQSTEGEDRILFLNILAAGEGINLTAATNVVFMELPWTWADIMQAVARCYGRISDIHGANVWYLLGEDTIDTMMYALIERKKEILGEAIMSNGNILDDLVAELVK